MMGRSKRGMTWGFLALGAAVACGSTTKNNGVGPSASGAGGAQGSAARGSGAQRDGAESGDGPAAGGDAFTPAPKTPPCPVSRFTKEACASPDQVCAYSDSGPCGLHGGKGELRCTAGEWAVSYSGAFDCDGPLPGQGGSSGAAGNGGASFGGNSGSGGGAGQAGGSGGAGKAGGGGSGGSAGGA